MCLSIDGVSYILAVANVTQRKLLKVVSEGLLVNFVMMKMIDDTQLYYDRFHGHSPSFDSNVLIQLPLGAVLCLATMGIGLLVCFVLYIMQ